MTRVRACTFVSQIYDSRKRNKESRSPSRAKPLYVASTAESFPRSVLHQLRGKPMLSKKSYGFFFTPRESSKSAKARKKRLVTN